MTATASAQVAQDRKIAAVDNSTDPNEPAGAVNETAIAVGTDRVLSVFHANQGTYSTKIGYAFSTLSGSTWSWSEEGRIDPVRTQVSPTQASRLIR